MTKGTGIRHFSFTIKDASKIDDAINFLSEFDASFKQFHYIKREYKNAGIVASFEEQSSLNMEGLIGLAKNFCKTFNPDLMFLQCREMIGKSFNCYCIVYGAHDVFGREDLLKDFDNLEYYQKDIINGKLFTIYKYALPLNCKDVKKIFAIVKTRAGTQLKIACDVARCQKDVFVECGRLPQITVASIYAPADNAANALELEFNKTGYKLQNKQELDELFKGGNSG